MTSISLEPGAHAPPPEPFAWDAGSAIFGGIWTILITDSFFRFVGGLESESVEQTIVNGATFGGSLTNAFHWADSVGMLSLGSYVALAEAIGFGTSAIISFFGTLETWRALVAIRPDAQDADQQKLLGLLSLGYRVTMFAWSLLSLSSFLAGTPILPLATSALLLTSFLFFVASTAYRSRIAAPQPS